MSQEQMCYKCGLQPRYKNNVYCQECLRAYRKAYSARYRVENRVKVLAHRYVWEAKKAGILVCQPCEVCGADSAHAHHDDYFKPLDVRWLCAKHHYDHHHGGEDRVA